MRRDLQGLSDTPFDLLVVGGGIHGACAAWDATLRGLSVALVDKADFGGGASANSLKIIHGGLRYLQQLDLRRMRASITERSILLRIAPHLAYPIPFVIATHGRGKESRSAMRLALWINDQVSFDRNRDLRPDKGISRGRILNREEVVALAPALEKPEMTGGALWYDVQAVDTERLTLAFLLSSAEKGARIANYVKVEELLCEGDRVAGARARDLISGQELGIRARIVLNAAGAWADEVPGRSPARAWFPPVGLAVNLVTRPLDARVAFGIRSNVPRERDPVGGGNRFLFFVPWRSSCLVGTFYRLHEGDRDKIGPASEDLETMLDECNDACAMLGLTVRDIGFYHAGLLPLKGPHESGDARALAQHSRIVDHESEGGMRGLVSIVGVKYTTARGAAEKAIDLVFSKMKRLSPPCTTDETPIYGGEAEIPPVEDRPAFEQRIARSHGCRFREVLATIDRVERGADPLVEGEELRRGEILHLVREEMAVKLGDVVLRRSGIGVERCPPPAILEAICRIMADELGWSEERRRTEMLEVHQVYAPLRIV